MDRNEQIKILETIKDDLALYMDVLIAQAKLGKIPPNWNAVEIRSLVADYTREQVAYIKMDRQTARRYSIDRQIAGL